MAVSCTIFQKLKMVRQIPIFSRLNWYESQKVARKVVMVEFKKGDLIVRQDSPADFFYSVISGRVQAFQTDAREQQVNFEFIHRGMHFGIISVLTGENHTQSFTALNDSVILTIARDDFYKLLQEIPQLGVELTQTLSRRLHKRQQGNQGVFESSIVSVYSPVKGAGGSTYAIHLAFNLVAETKKKVLFIDINSSSSRLVDSGGSGGEVQWKIPSIQLQDIVGDDEKIHSHIHQDESGVDMIRVEMDVTKPLAVRQISPFVSTLVGEYHYVIVDLPSHMDDVVFEALAQSDLVHLIAFDQPADLQMVRQVIDRLEVALRESFSVEKIRVIIRSSRERNDLSIEEIDRSMDYAVYQLLPHIALDDPTRSLESNCLRLSRQALANSDYMKLIRYIAREIGKVRVGLVLGGGAALGLAHIGVIKVLEEENIPVDVIVGSSMGALVGALWAVGNSAEEMRDMAAEFKSVRNIVKLCDPVFPILGLLGGRAIRRWLKRHLGNEMFYQTRIPLKVVAYDLQKRQEIVIQSGMIADAVHQSVAIPGILEPVRQGDRVIIDGGVLNPLPTNVLVDSGITKIIAVNVLQSPDHVSRGLEIRQRKLRENLKRPLLRNPVAFLGLRIGGFFNRMFAPGIPDIIVQTLQASEYVIAEQSARQADVVIQPDLVGFNWYELTRYGALIKSGELAARASLAGMKRLVNLE